MIDTHDRIWNAALAIDALAVNHEAITRPRPTDQPHELRQRLERAGQALEAIAVLSEQLRIDIGEVLADVDDAEHKRCG